MQVFYARLHSDIPIGCSCDRKIILSAFKRKCYLFVNTFAPLSRIKSFASRVYFPLVQTLLLVSFSPLYSSLLPNDVFVIAEAGSNEHDK